MPKGIYSRKLVDTDKTLVRKRSTRRKTFRQRNSRGLTPAMREEVSKLLLKLLFP
jgi:hypothetical protein